MGWWKPWTVDVYGKWSNTTHEVGFLRFWTKAAAEAFIARQDPSDKVEYRVRRRA
jgi:hypothetical protein